MKPMQLFCNVGGYIIHSVYTEKRAEGHCYMSKLTTLNMSELIR